MRKSAPLFCALLLSLSARRAWIEIDVSDKEPLAEEVALRKESVDRNTMRRDFKSLGLLVALRKESVDRNSFGLSCLNPVSCRSPQGERG